MRNPALALALLGTCLPAFAAHTVTVVQLEQQVAAVHAKADPDAGRQLANLRLTERLSMAREADLEKMLPGEKSRQALRALADESAFRDPPPSDIPVRPGPDFAEQRRIMGLVVSYVSRSIPQLPNFLATRTTTRFEDMPQRKADYVNQYEPLHPVGSASAQVTYQDGREVIDSGSKFANASFGDRGLSTWGEFGPILSTVLLDAARNKLAWLRWEQGDSGPLAVFAYSVPRENSHYEVDYCCVADSEGRTHVFHELAAYRGQMAVDPATGVILRLTIQASFKPGEPVSQADLLVDYGPVGIGGKTYICPVRSLALSRAQSLGQEQMEMVQQGPHGANGAALAPLLVGSTADVTEQTLLNEAAFTEYHVFRAETRIVEGTAGDLPPLGAEPTAPAASASETAAATANSAGTATSHFSAAPPAASAEAAGSNAATASAPAPPPPPAAAPAPEPAEEPEVVATAGAGVPDLPGEPKPPVGNSGYTLRTTSRLVDAAVVALDKKGQPVTDLKPDELQILDNGRPQQVKFFSQAGAGTLTASGSKPLQGGPNAANEEVTNRPSDTSTKTLAPGEARTTVLLIDSSNVAFADLTNARQEILRFLKTVPTDERVGLYILHSFGFQILLEPMEDHAQVASKLAAWMPSAQDLLQAQHEEDRNRQNMEYVQHVTDLLHVNGNTPTGEDDSFFPVDPQLRSLGDAPESRVLAALQGVGRHLAAIPGRKSLVWVASDNVLADFSEKAPDNERGDKGLDPLALRARETLNEAHVSIYPLDVSQLEAGGVGASQHSANVQLSPAANPQAQMMTLPPELQKEAAEALAKSQRDIYPGRVTAQLQQDTHPIQGVFRDLATATGGRALRRAGDIAAELNSIVADGRSAYLLSFTPDTPADGKYHLLTVKTTRPGVTLRFRAGYLYSKEPVTMKDRFREAVWQAREAGDIGLTALPVREATPAGKRPAVQLNIAATDLEMAQAGDRWTDKIDVFLVVRDDSGLHASVSGKRLALALKPATYQQAMKDGISLEDSLPKVPEGGLLRVIVVDENSRRIGTVTLPHGAGGRE